MATRIEQRRYRTALCPYLTVGNRRMLVHLDAFCVPQTLQWPRPGAPDRLGWRDPFDEWPYWEEMGAEAVRSRMPWFEYADGARDYLHDATDVAVDYVEDTNVLEGRYVLPGGAVIEITTFVPPGRDVWVRHYRVRGQGKLVLQSEFFEKAVRGHALTHLGHIHFRGALDAAPRGVYVIMSTGPLPRVESRVEVPIPGQAEWTLFTCMAEDLAGAAALGKQALADGFEAMKAETVAADRAWVGQARPPTARHPFVLKHHRRWLLANLLFTARDGAMVCGARPFWSFIWPRDCSQQAAAYAVAGFLDEARRVVRWLLECAPDSGVHEARYRSDGQPMLLDNRPRQGDNPGFVCWAAAVVCREAWDREWAEGISQKLYRLADHLVNDRDKETRLPLPEADHREGEIAESISIAASAIGGLRGAAEIARRLGEEARAARYQARAEEIRRAAEQHLWNPQERYFIASVKPRRERADVGIAWAVHPFHAWERDDPKSVQSVARLIRDRWNAEAGGVLAAPGTPYESYWMYYAGILLLGVAGIGDKKMEAEILAALEKNVSPQGLIPEQIGRASGLLWGCAPLSTSQADLLLYAYMKGSHEEAP